MHHLQPSGLCGNGPTRLQSSLLDAQDARPACTVGAGACTQQTPEAAVECGQVAESCFERNGADRVAGAAQAHRSALQPRMQQKLMGRYPCNGTEGSQEMIGTHRDVSRQLLQRQWLITVRLYPAQGFCHTPLVPMTRRVRELFSPSR